MLSLESMKSTHQVMSVSTSVTLLKDSQPTQLLGHKNQRRQRKGLADLMCETKDMTYLFLCLLYFLNPL